MKAEFGNLEQIALLNREKELRLNIEEELKAGVVGKQEIEGCGACGAPVKDFGRIEVIDGKKHEMCENCGSIMKIF